MGVGRLTLTSSFKVCKLAISSVHLASSRNSHILRAFFLLFFFSLFFSLLLSSWKMFDFSLIQLGNVWFSPSRWTYWVVFSWADAPNEATKKSYFLIAATFQMDVALLQRGNIKSMGNQERISCNTSRTSLSHNPSFSFAESRVKSSRVFTHFSEDFARHAGMREVAENGFMRDERRWEIDVARWGSTFLVPHFSA